MNSSIIAVIRGPRATLWGSVYLDEHGEEDRDLKYVFCIIVELLIEGLFFVFNSPVSSAPDKKE